MRNAVALAIEALSWMEHEGLSERAAFARAAKQLHVTKADELKTAQWLVLETSRRRNFIDHLIQGAAGGHIELSSLQHGLSSFLRLFCYWAKFHETSRGGVVRILQAARSVLGWKDLHPIEPLFGRMLAVDPAEALAKLSSDEALALSLFHPAWFLSACTFILGRSAALKLMLRNFAPAPSYIRINTLRGDEETSLREIEKAGIEAKPVEHLPLTFRVLSSRRPIVRTEPYRAGRITIQDKASVLASLVAAPRPGESILDLCAAPGAKTAHLAELMQNKGAIYSIDKSSARMSLWRREMSRLGVEIGHPLLADASKPLPIDSKAEVVVLDPPCSNTGTFWRTPSTKWRMTRERVHRLAATQSVMLENASRFVCAGGTLVYSTCTILAEEDEHVVNRFLRLNPDFESISSIPEVGMQGLYGLNTCQRLYPHLHDCNGHFLAKMRRAG